MIKDLPFLKKSLFFAEVSAWAYKSPKEAKKLYAEKGFKSVYFNHNGAQAYLLSNNNEVVIAFRGTEPNKLSDIIADIKIKLTPSASGVGKVHSGFKDALNKIWPDIVDTLIKNKNSKNIYFTRA